VPSCALALAAELRFIADYHEHPGYIDALRASVTEHWQAHGRTAHLLISFHGIPERYVHQGDPYFCAARPRRACSPTNCCCATGMERELSVALWSDGLAEALHPHGAHRDAGPRVREVTLVCPGFAWTCLETLEEIDIENRDVFMRAGVSVTSMCQRSTPAPAMRNASRPDRAALSGLGRTPAWPPSSAARGVPPREVERATGPCWGLFMRPASRSMMCAPRSSSTNAWGSPRP